MWAQHEVGKPKAAMVAAPEGRRYVIDYGNGRSMDKFGPEQPPCGPQPRFIQSNNRNVV